MANVEEIEEEAPTKGGKLGLILGLVLGLVAGGTSFFATFSGMLPIGAAEEDSGAHVPDKPVKQLPNVSFFALDPIVVAIRASDKYRMLRFSGQLQISPEYMTEAEVLKPRIIDVMNTYLNALRADQFEDPIAMIKLRAQLLRRIQIVTGKDNVQDLLIREFILQ